MTDNKRVTNKQILDVLRELKMNDAELNVLAVKMVSRMVKLKSMEDWFDHVNKSEIAWSVAYNDLELTREENAIGEGYPDKCIFVGEPEKLIDKYKENTND